MLIGNKQLYPEGTVPAEESNNAFHARFSIWAEQNGLSAPEYLLPIANRKTAITPFRFERRFAASGMTPPSKQLVDSLGPWHYQIDWSGTTTRDLHHDLRDVWQELDWKVHRYRSSLLVDLAAQIAGADRAAMSVLDVTCHCGILALEFGEAGFGSVRGVDLRPENIRQAQFLQSTFDCPNVSFEALNARNLKGNNADIVFCGGLLYHVTFPVELMSDLFAATGEVLIFDSLCQNHPFSGFHLYAGKDVGQSLEGDNAIELVPTYRVIIDLLKAVGFPEVYEVLGDRAEEVPFYKDRSIRSFVAAKPGSKFQPLLRSLVVREG